MPVGQPPTAPPGATQSGANQWAPTGGIPSGPPPASGGPGGPTYSAATGPVPPPQSAPNGRRNWFIAGGLVVAALAAVGAMAAFSGNGDDDGNVAAVTTTAPILETTTTEPDDEPIEEIPGDELPPSVGELAESVTLLVTVGADGREIAGGSGTLIDPTGLILTNAHVVEQIPGVPYETLSVRLTDDPANPPEARYEGTVVAFDSALDLAVVQITADASGAPTTVTDLPTIAIGDSDLVGLGDDIRVLGYPGIGGDTITLTAGSVAGFTAQAGVGNRAWIKTDATIAGGNSGGLAFNDAGELIGIPTLASAGQDAAITDCRFVEDTNGDNVLDENDTCIPIGGFINGVRPVNLALEIIELGRLGEPIAPVEEPVDTSAMTGADFDVPVFSSGVNDNGTPVDEITQISPSAERVCAFWEYEGLVDGATWDALWSVEGELSEAFSFISEEWIGGESGTWWVCAIGNETEGLPPGTYELVLAIDGETFASNTIAVSDAPTSLLTLQNDLDVFICFLQVSPAVAQNWGPDDLGGTETILPGASREFEVTNGLYDIRASDCENNTLSEVTGVNVSGPQTVALN